MSTDDTSNCSGRSSLPGPDPAIIASNIMMSDEDTACWLAFSELSGSGFGPKKVLQAYRHMGSARAVWEAGADDLKRIDGVTAEIAGKVISRRKQIDPGRLLDDVRRKGIDVYPICHPDYPLRLREISDPPCVLYAKGKMSQSDFDHPVGVVGTRRPTAYGRSLAKEFAGGLAAAGVTVVSGMAVGIDSLAHRGAIEAGGKTFAILGTGVDRCYPSSNRPLYELLIEGEKGAVISEFPPGTPAEPWRFPARNRIISGMSLAVLVVEAGESSGSLITANLANNQGRDVFSIPGRPDMEMCKGTNQLIASGARLTTSYLEILESLGLVPGKGGQGESRSVQVYGKEKDIYQLLSKEPVHFDELCAKMDMKAGEISAALTMLELAGAVLRHPGDCYSRLD